MQKNKYNEKERASTFPYTPPKDNFTVEQILDRQQEKFETDFLNVIYNFSINSKPILVDYIDSKMPYRDNNRNSKNLYTEQFLHLCSKELHRDYSIPCQNIEPYNLCSGDNLTVVINNKIRAICLYRACRTHWIPKILNLEKLNDSRVKLYLNEKENKIYCLYSDKLKKRNRYYVIIFKNLDNACKLITAYPVTVLKDIQTIRKYKLIEKTDSAKRNP